MKQNYYWVVENRFLAGEYPRNIDEKSSLDKIGSLIRAGVSAFVDLTGEDEGLKAYSHLLGKFEGVSHQRFPIRDMSVPAGKGITTAILDAVDDHILHKRIVYLHCWGGVGRTGMIVGCWLARHGRQGKEALERLRELWQECPKSSYRDSPETREQVQYILDWEESR
ncbi:MAG: protein-tyrosine phosphatase family protein [Thermodesulfobacteriota bacterium]